LDIHKIRVLKQDAFQVLDIFSAKGRPIPLSSSISYLLNGAPLNSRGREVDQLARGQCRLPSFVRRDRQLQELIAQAVPYDIVEPVVSPLMRIGFHLQRSPELDIVISCAIVPDQEEPKVSKRSRYAD
jgi:hypothetical protein